MIAFPNDQLGNKGEFEKIERASCNQYSKRVCILLLLLLSLYRLGPPTDQLPIKQVGNRANSLKVCVLLLNGHWTFVFS